LARGMRVRRMSGESGIRWASRSLVNQVGSGMHEIFEGGAEIKNQIEIRFTRGQAGAQQCCARTNLVANGRMRRASVRRPRRERFPGLLREIADSFRKVSDGFVRKGRIRVTCVHSECG
jgi:hypothetical protein